MDKQELIKSLKQQRFPDDIIKSFEEINRGDFISKSLKNHVYEDRPLPIGQGQTISQPYTIAFMLNLLGLTSNQKILEIGSGSGYVLALMNNISKNSTIYGIERIKQLAENSLIILKNKKNIIIIHADGTKGLEKQAPFDRILISASANKIPKKIVNQLDSRGIMVCVVKNSIIQIKKQPKKTKIKEYPGFVFVPLIKD